MPRPAWTALLIATCTACTAPDAAPGARSAEGTADPAAGTDTATPPSPARPPTPPEPEGGALAAAWTSGPITGGSAEALGILAAVRVARHDGFDRVVFDFGGDAVPRYRISVVGGEATRCGSGEAVRMEGPHQVEVSFEPARAHSEEGVPTVTERSLSPGLPVVRTLELTCDFEGHVTWLIGVAAGPVMRAGVLMEPNRLVLDFAAEPPR
jgi:hypothetical protein